MHLEMLPRAVLGLPKPYPVPSSTFPVTPGFKNSGDFRPGTLADHVQSPFQLVVSLIAWEGEDGMLKSILLSFSTQNSSAPDASGVD